MFVFVEINKSQATGSKSMISQTKNCHHAGTSKLTLTVPRKDNGWLVISYGIRSLVGYSMPNPICKWIVLGDNILNEPVHISLHTVKY